MTDEVKGFAFTPQELALLSRMPGGEADGWSARFWCAKEAVAKAAGQGMIDGPQGLEVQELDMHNGLVKVRLGPKLGGRMPDNDSSALTAFTFRDGEMVVAISAPMKTKDEIQSDEKP
jgi:phosphopantetheinyl transferase